VESLTISADLEHSLSGNYVRGILRRGSTEWAVLGVADNESADTVENSLTFALLWLERARESSRRATIAGLRLILPKGGARVVAQRIGALRPQLAPELYERDPVREVLQRLDPRAAGNIDSWIVPQRETQSLLDRARSTIDPIVALAPSAIRLIRRWRPERSGCASAALRLPSGMKAASSLEPARVAKSSARLLGRR
jgi:hypothetical protein